MLPNIIKKDELIEIKTLFARPGNERFQNKHFDVTASFEGETFFNARFLQSISANPYLSFFFKPEKEGNLVVEWTEKDGRQWAVTTKIEFS